MWTRLQALRVKKGLTQQEAATRLGMSRQVYNNYELGKREPGFDVLRQLAGFYGTTSGYLIGEGRSGPAPLLGVIKAGVPLLSEANYDGEVNPGDIRCDFALRVSGDSMVYAGINDGDIVLLTAAGAAQSGSVVAAGVDNDYGITEATLKYLVKNRGGVYLRPANPAYKDTPFTPGHRVLGVFAGLLRDAAPGLGSVFSLQTQAERLTSEWVDLIGEARAAGLDAADFMGAIAFMRKAKG